ncbi:MAG: cupin domain-containing protein [Chloroflexi bacterium]|nr:cupin domain-containing protein [Chloroflexota bacterium]MDA1271235.1 cupin domain-containing protein [Chloroflexota bacterium]
MPFVLKEDASSGNSAPGTQVDTLVGKENGGNNLTVVSAGIDPGAGLALHVHPGYEEATLVVEGQIEAVLDDETRTLMPGDLLLAPTGVKHTITNRSDKPARVLAIYPTTAPERIFV